MGFDLSDLLSRKPPVKRTMRPRAVRPIEDLEAEDNLKKKQYANKRALELVKTDPDVEREYIASILGIKINPPDPDKVAKQEIKTLIAKQALEEIKNDPKLRAQFARRQVEELIGEPASDNFDGERDERHRGGFSDLADQLDEIAEVKERLAGSDKGILGALTDPKVLVALLGLLTSAKGGAAQQEPQYIISVSGQMTSVTESQYKQLLQQGKLQPVAQLTGPKPPEAPTPKAPSDTDTIVRDRIAEMKDWIDSDPSEFVDYLEASLANPKDKILWDLLKTASYDQVANLLTYYKSDPELGTMVEFLLSEEGRIWAEKVIELVKETDGKTNNPTG